MNRRIILTIGVALLTGLGTSAFASEAICAQDSAPEKPQPAANPPGGPPPAAPLPPEPKKTKKIWTNDNLGESSSPVSPAESGKPPAATKNAALSPASPQVAAAYKKQIAALGAQLAATDKQITDLKNFLKGEAPGAAGLQLHKGYSTEPIPDQIRKLEDKKKNIAAQIDAVLDAARKKGVEPGQLR